MSLSNIYKNTVLTFFATILLFSAGCATHNISQHSHYRDAMNTKWLLEDLDAHGVTNFAHIWVRFDGDRKIYGSGGCNSFRGYYSTENGEFKTGPLAMTRKACPPALSSQESKFMQAIENVRSMYTQDGLLYMEGNGHRLRFSKTYE